LTELITHWNRSRIHDGSSKGSERPDFVKNEDSNHSDIDVIGSHPRKIGADRVVVVSCKNWQSGFNPARVVANINNGKIGSGSLAWKSFRELVIPKWSEAYIKAVEDATKEREFVYVTAVTNVCGDRAPWEQNQVFSKAIGGNPIRLLDLQQMLNKISPTLTKTIAGTEVGRMLQLFKAADMLPEPKAD
jgi:hypothetical protein